MIKNVKNNKLYIGQSTDIKNRWVRHKSELNNNRHINNHLQFAWNKYGEDCFIFAVIEECSVSELDEREKFYINKYNSGKVLPRVSLHSTSPLLLLLGYIGSSDYRITIFLE